MLLFLYTAEFPEYQRQHTFQLSLARRVAIIADKYCLAKLRDHAITKSITGIKLHLSKWLRKDNHTINISIEHLRRFWQVKLDCFASVRVVILEELASAVGLISERPDFQGLLAENKDLNLELIKVLSKRANSVTNP